MAGRIYTRRGDAGATDSPGTGRVAKDHSSIELIGTLDELNAHLGLAAAHLAQLGSPALERVQAALSDAQRRLFPLIAELFGRAAPSGSADGAGAAQAARVLEELIDALDAELPPLAGFILPGGRVAAAELHVARTICRRAERRLVANVPAAPAPQAWAEAQIYLNRLSDFLFMAARAANHAGGLADIPAQRPPEA